MTRRNTILAAIIVIAIGLVVPWQIYWPELSVPDFQEYMEDVANHGPLM